MENTTVHRGGGLSGRDTSSVQSDPIGRMREINE